MVFDIDKIAPDTSQKILAGLFVILWYLSFAYYSPEETKMLLDSMGLYNIAPSYDLPSIIPLAFFLWIIIGLVDMAYIHLKVMSDIAIAEGMDASESCVGGKLHMEGDWGWIRVGGTKAFPIEGSKVWIGLKAHIHRIGTHIVFEGLMIPDTPLDYVPFELKRGIRQRRAGFFGVQSCSVGYISAQEHASHKEFNPQDYKEYLTDEEKNKLGSNLNTSEFINEIAIKNKTVDMDLQLLENEHTSLTNSLETIKEVGEAVRTEQKKGILTYIFGG